VRLAIIRNGIVLEKDGGALGCSPHALWIFLINVYPLWGAPGHHSEAASSSRMGRTRYTPLRTLDLLLWRMPSACACRCLPQRSPIPACTSPKLCLTCTVPFLTGPHLYCASPLCPTVPHFLPPLVRPTVTCSKNDPHFPALCRGPLGVRRTVVGLSCPLQPVLHLCSSPAALHASSVSHALTHTAVG